MEAPVSKTNVGLTYGLISGLIICIITLLQYLGGLDMFLSPVGYVSYLVIITFAVLASLKVRKSNEGFLEFKQALKVTFTVFAIAMLMQTIFLYILFNYIDVSFKEAVAQETMNKTEQMLRKFGMSDSKIDEALESERNKDQYSFGRVMLGYAISCIIAFIFCLLISVIVKKNKPAFSNI
jgi:ribose/xylose/arabinose/galactoside ABC-type transport system permease subunit